MSGIEFPYLLFKTKKIMNDHSADDMRYGDLSEYDLKNHFGLHQASNFVDPYTLKRINPISPHRWQSPVYEKVLDILGAKQALSTKECTKILFDEFRHYANTFALYGPYNHLIKQMINHMQYGHGTSFQSLALSQAFEERILMDKSKNGILNVLKVAIARYINWDKKILTPKGSQEVENHIREETRLPKFNKFWDTFNGTKITVHDIHATHITLQSLQINDNRFHATVLFRAQDHFGLDKQDIIKYRNHHIVIFKIWFILQRYQKFGFKPFFTNMSATVTLSGSRIKNTP